jgi:hypothetical protein
LTSTVGLEHATQTLLAEQVMQAGSVQRTQTLPLVS